MDSVPRDLTDGFCSNEGAMMGQSPEGKCVSTTTCGRGLLGPASNWYDIAESSKGEEEGEWRGEERVRGSVLGGEGG